MSNPINQFADRLIDLQLERHAWLSQASKQIRKWREEDQREKRA